MHTDVILTNKRCTHTQSNYTNTKLKPGLGASYANRPGNGVSLFYTPDPHGGIKASIDHNSNAEICCKSPTYYHTHPRILHAQCLVASIQVCLG